MMDTKMKLMIKKKNYVQMLKCNYKKIKNNYSYNKLEQLIINNGVYKMEFLLKNKILKYLDQEIQSKLFYTTCLYGYSDMLYLMCLYDWNNEYMCVKYIDMEDENFDIQFDNLKILLKFKYKYIDFLIYRLWYSDNNSRRKTVFKLIKNYKISKEFKNLKKSVKKYSDDIYIPLINRIVYGGGIDKEISDYIYF